MEKPVSLNELFEKKIFRIPDYQRGYAWQKDQLKDFWEDLINLYEDRSHYTGVLTLKKINRKEIKENENEYWLVDDHQYNMYDVVDGQQRLTTFIIFLQALINIILKLDEFKGKNAQDIYLTDSLTLSNIIENYLYKIKPQTGGLFRTYKFGYTVDNPSYEYMRYKIFNEDGAGTINETFYTLNLHNALEYFEKQLENLYNENGLNSIKNIYKKLTKQFLFNEYVIDDEFDVFVSFETMNNRGKKLSDLELLKNRLIYLSTLYSDDELDKSSRDNLRKEINNAWKEVYGQLGRNKTKPLNDDDFLKAHWILYFQYSRQKGNDYIKFLLNEQFSPQKIHKKIETYVQLEQPVELKTKFEIEDEYNLDEDTTPPDFVVQKSLLAHEEIITYVQSLKSCAVHWFNSYFPHLSEELTIAEIEIIEKLNRLGMGYFRPLIMSILKNEKSIEKKVNILKKIERFIFINFKLNQYRTNYKDSIFYNYARELDKGEKSIENIENVLDAYINTCFDEDNYFKINDFWTYLNKKFNPPLGASCEGYYGWHGLKYFLFEYELELLNNSRQSKVSWESLLKTDRADTISIEHIFPQSQTPSWLEIFKDYGDNERIDLGGSIGNLLLLSTSINSSLQRDDFKDKKNPKFAPNGEKIRNGYSDGSHSEIEVSQYPEWTAKKIEERGLKLINFMTKRWDLNIKDEDKKKLLFLDFVE